MIEMPICTLVSRSFAWNNAIPAFDYSFFWDLEDLVLFLQTTNHRVRVLACLHRSISQLCPNKQASPRHKEERARVVGFLRFSSFSCLVSQIT